MKMKATWKPQGHSAKRWQEASWRKNASEITPAWRSPRKKETGRANSWKPK